MAVRMAQHLMARLPELRFEPVARRIRCLVGDETVADTTDALLVWEPRRIVPVYALPPGDIHADLVPFTSATPDLDALPPVLGPENFGIHTCGGQALSLWVGGRELDGRRVPSRRSRARRTDHAGLARVRLDRGGAAGHRASPRPVRADRRPVLQQARRGVARRCHAGGQPPTDRRVRDPPAPALVPAPRGRADGPADAERDHVGLCVQGSRLLLLVGDGSRAGRDIAWTYTDPLHEVAAIRDRVCFFAERTDLDLDGERTSRPVTPWSTPEEQEAQDFSNSADQPETCRGSGGQGHQSRGRNGGQPVSLFTRCPKLSR